MGADAEPTIDVTEPQDSAEDLVTDDLVTSDLLVEEVSIDGMCGVY